MPIRKATPADAKAIAKCLYLAMDDIIHVFIQDNNADKALSFLEDMATKPNNQYSHDCCWVFENEDGVVGATNVYLGDDLAALRQPVKTAIKAQFGHDFYAEDETKPGEIYIDCIGVLPSQQGRGIGSKILRFLIDKYGSTPDKHLSLLVDNLNPKAKKLYQRLGFEVVERCQLAGEQMERMYWKK